MPEQPRSGAYAASLLGLSEQVPSRVVFLTDGPARKVKLGKREITLQHTTPRNMAAAGRKTRLQALMNACRAWVQGTLLPALAARIAETPGPDEWRLEIDPDVPDGQCLLFHYPSVFPPDAAGYVPPRVKIELGARTDDWKADYQAMLGPMFFGATPGFDEIIAAAAAFETTFNATA